jgi:Transposase DDE domain
MHIDIVPNRHSKPAVLLRESYREGKKVRKRTLANLSRLPRDQIESIRQILKGVKLAPIDAVFEIVARGSRFHGHVDAVLEAMKQLGFSKLLASRPSRERSLTLGMVVARIVEPQSKLATSTWWHTTTLPEMLGVADADEDDLYGAMDWLLERQRLIEKKLAARHLENDAMALYDLTSSYFEGVTCPLAARGHNRDGKKGKLQVNYGLLTNRRGIPVAVSVFPGNTGDPKTLLPQVEKVREDFGLERFVLVGDRGMITQKQVDALRELEGIDWITALRPEAIKKLIEAGAIQMGLFDEHDLFELTHPEFPDERLVACRNTELAARRSGKRTSLLEATAAELEKVRAMVGRGRLHGRGEIAVRVGRILQKYKIGRHYRMGIHDDGFDFAIDEKKLAEQIARDSRNPELAKRRLARCKGHIEAIAQQLEKVRDRIQRGQLHGKGAIGVRVGKVLDKYKVGKHFQLDIQESSFEFAIDTDKVAAEAALDGIYVVRTSLAAERMDTDDTVRSYKLLSQVEQAFRSFKTLDLKVRPIRHRLEERVRAHIFLCSLAYYVQWHMLEAWRPLLFCDEDQQSKATRDPVAPARRSAAALRKVHTKRLEDGSRVHSFRTLLTDLSTIVRNQCRQPGAGPEEPTFCLTTLPDAQQRKAYELLKTIRV